MDADDKALSYIAFDKLTAESGIVSAIRDSWWSVHPERGVMIYKKHFPQCNSNENIGRRLTEKLYPWAETRFIPLVLVRVDPRDYV